MKFRGGYYTHSVLPTYDKPSLSKLRLRTRRFKILSPHKPAKGGMVAECDPLPGIVTGDIPSHGTLDSIRTENNVGVCRGSVGEADFIQARIVWARRNADAALLEMCYVWVNMFHESVQERRSMSRQLS